MCSCTQLIVYLLHLWDTVVIEYGHILHVLTLIEHHLFNGISTLSFCTLQVIYSAIAIVGRSVCVVMVALLFFVCKKKYV